MAAVSGPFRLITLQKGHTSLEWAIDAISPYNLASRSLLGQTLSPESMQHWNAARDAESQKKYEVAAMEYQQKINSGRNPNGNPEMLRLRYCAGAFEQIATPDAGDFIRFGQGRISRRRCGCRREILDRAADD